MRKPVEQLTRVWEGRTPEGHSLRVERDARGRWVVTVAEASRSRRETLETALVEAACVDPDWAARLASTIGSTASAPDGVEPPVAAAPPGQTGDGRAQVD